METVNRARRRRQEHNRSIIDGILWSPHCDTTWPEAPSRFGIALMTCTRSTLLCKPRTRCFREGESWKCSEDRSDEHLPEVHANTQAAPAFASELHNSARRIEHLVGHYSGLP